MPVPTSVFFIAKLDLGAILGQSPGGGTRAISVGTRAHSYGGIDLNTAEKML